MDETHKLGIGARIRQLREGSPYKQQTVADKLGIGLRAYQKLEEVGTTRYERCEELAKIFDVDPEWIWDGEKRDGTPDLMGQIDGEPAWATELRNDLKGLRADLNDIREALGLPATPHRPLSTEPLRGLEDAPGPTPLENQVAHELQSAEKSDEGPGTKDGPQRPTPSRGHDSE